MSENVLTIENATMQFGGVVAVDNLNLKVDKNQIVSLIGPNGAGKTTAFNVVTGVYAPTNGAVWFEGRKIIENTPHGKMKKLYKGQNAGQYSHIIAPTPDKITQMGIARTFQNIRLWKSQTVFENVLIAKHCRRSANLLSATFRLNADEEKRQREECEELLKVLGLEDVRDELATGLPYGLQRRVEIARALATQPKLLLLLRQVKGDQWECLAKPGKRMQPGTKVSFGDGSLTAVVDETLEDGNKYVTFYYDTETLYEKLDEFGKMPLPPYITKQLEDQSQYQTVYAKELGSAAAPTAGLHFTPELMDTIRAKGVNIAEVTLHVGLGTFRPVQEDEITDHKMHSEWYCIDEKTAQMIRDTKAAGHRVIAVGTTSCRTLEAVAAKYGEIRACSGNTSIFLYPGVKFNCIDGLITNFHLPESTLIMLVSALYGYEKTMAAYKVAVQERYRFFSFGDAMAIL